MSETKSTDNTETDTEALIRFEYRRKAFCGLDSMCHWDFAHDNGENPFITNTGLHYVYNYQEMKEIGMGISVGFEFSLFCRFCFAHNSSCFG